MVEEAKTGIVETALGTNEYALTLKLAGLTLPKNTITDLPIA